MLKPVEVLRSWKSFTQGGWSIMRNYIKLFTPIATSLDRLQGEESISTEAISPCLFSIRLELEQVQLETDNQSMNSLKMNGIKMKQTVITRRFADMLEIIGSNRGLIIPTTSHPALKLD